MRNLEDKYKNKELRNFYQEVTNVRGTRKQHMIFGKDSEGHWIGDEQKLMEGWANYFEKLLNGDNDRVTMVEREEEYGEVEGKELQREEVMEVIRRLKNNKSSGEDMILAELIKYGGIVIYEEKYQLVAVVWDKE